jgi:hypothetical protein
MNAEPTPDSVRSLFELSFSRLHESFLRVDLGACDILAVLYKKVLCKNWGINIISAFLCEKRPLM